MRYFIMYYETTSITPHGGQILGKGTLNFTTDNGYPNRIKTEKLVKDLDNSCNVVDKVSFQNTMELSQSDFEDWIYDPDSKEKTPLQILKEIEKVDLVLKRRDQLSDFFDKYITIYTKKGSDEILITYIQNSTRLKEDAHSLEKEIGKII